MSQWEHDWICKTTDNIGRCSTPEVAVLLVEVAVALVEVAVALVEVAVALVEVAVKFVEVAVTFEEEGIKQGDSGQHGWQWPGGCTLTLLAVQTGPHTGSYSEINIPDPGTGHV